MKALNLLLLSVLIVLTVACNRQKDLIYFRNGEIELNDAMLKTYTPTLKPDDLLSIIISSENPEASAAFNPPPDFVKQPGNNGYRNGIPAHTGYLIDADGIINLPILGKMNVAGLSRIEATALLEEKLKEYLIHPVVQISILNFKVTVLGEVHSPGTFKIPHERITILEALGLAGDLKITGKRQHVTVVRNDNSQNVMYEVDLRSKDLLSSPVYYLEQNDVVYVTPNKAAAIEGTTFYKVGSFIISISSVVATLVVVSIK